MSAGLAGIRLAVIGGDDREIYMIRELQKQGAYIIGVGFEKAPSMDGVELLSSPMEVIGKADALLFPMYGTDESGVVRGKYTDSTIVLNQELLKMVKPNVPLFIGWARPALKSAAKMLEIPIIEVANLDQVAILNSIPSAEGAIQMAMEVSEITIHGSQSFVLGLGRCGWTLARMLNGIGASVTGVARRPEDLARGLEMGINVLHFGELEEKIQQAEFIFNTVPKLILDKTMLDQMNKDAIIIDIASSPGGMDFDYAKSLGIRALLAPGLPGKVAPKTAGKILAQIYPQLILRHLTTNDHLTPEE
ncbi:MAG: dipicolinate synthase subunit DpsA [Desulfitobacterium sp.]|nr:dipicolinate synthase subunit DpsA [Desulfitobacterium sp.]